MLAILVVSVIVVGFCAVLLLFSSLRSARFLEQRCVAELRQLKTLLSSRHLILSHLADSIPSRLEGLFDRKRLQKQLRAAEEGLDRLDPAAPDFSHLRAMEDNEQCLIEAVNDLKETLEATGPMIQIDAVTGCLNGLGKNSKEIFEAVSTYNTAAFTYASFLRSSLIARRKYHCQFAILDLEPPGSSMSGDSGVSSGDRVAS